MIEVRYFANIREAMGLSQEQLPAAAATTVALLLEALVQKHGEKARAVLAANKVLAAVNHEVVPLSTAVRDGDEVAFFPPVTGG